MTIKSRLSAGQLSDRIWISGGRGVSVQSGTEAHVASYARARGSFCSGVKRTVREAGHSPSSIAEDKNEWRYASTPPNALVAYTVTDLS
jgi:hypothetical protein